MKVSCLVVSVYNSGKIQHSLDKIKRIVIAALMHGAQVIAGLYKSTAELLL